MPMAITDFSWLKCHARSKRNRSRSRANSSRMAAQRAHQQFAAAAAFAPRVEYVALNAEDEDSATLRDAPWTSDTQAERHYARLGWEVVAIRKDGNCLFRALSDQLYGHERRHLELRRRLVDFIARERAFFDPFVAGEGAIEYCSRLRESGAWGGHPELVAAARLLGIHVVVHTGPMRRLRIEGDGKATTTATPKRMQPEAGKTVHLLLKHDHYSSLRERPEGLKSPVVKSPVAKSPTAKSPVAKSPTAKSAGVVLLPPSSLPEVSDSSSDKRARSPAAAHKAERMTMQEMEAEIASESPVNSPVHKKQQQAPQPPVEHPLELEVVSGCHEEMPECGVVLPRRVVFDRGRRRSGSMLTMLHVSSPELSASGSCFRPKPPRVRMVPIARPVRRCFHQGRPVGAAS